MDIAIVTGASSALGLAISRRLIELGFRVYGLGGDYKDCSLQNVNFKPTPCDLADPADLHRACMKILDKEKGIYLLVNNAKYFGNASFEQMGLQEMERILQINLLCPLVLMRIFGKSLCSLRGYVIQLGAPFSESSRGGPAGAASAGGLKWMGEQLFNEHRDNGVKVCYLSPEPNRSQDARKRIRPGARPEASIDPEAVAQAVEQILQSPYGNVVTEMIIRPLRIDEPEVEPVWKIPYPDPKPIPYTVPREMIEAEEQLEEEDWKNKQQQKRKRRETNKKAASQQSAKKQPTRKKSAEKQSEKSSKPDDSQEKAPPESSGEDNKPRKKTRRKPKPPKQVVGFHDKPDEQKQSFPDEEAGRDAREKQKSSKKGDTARKSASRTKKKSAHSKSGDKQPRKATKRAKKKTATKKAVKKATRKRTSKKAAKSSGTDKNND